MLGAAHALCANLGIRLDPEGEELFGAYCEAARSALGKRAFDEVLARGQTMDSEQAVDLAMRMPLPLSAEKPGQMAPAARAGEGAIARLTRREREVAALVAQGRSNREIADSLVITERTVEGHVSNLLAKLDFRSRSQISAWAVEQGLTRAAS